MIIPMSKSFSIMLQRKLIYTAVTRAKDQVFFVGDIEALRIAVSGMWDEDRMTGLCEAMC
ncbi:ATP-binding domain-containing protein [Methyloglobulus morosus]|nr:ATP-binding domain-containing protein [Methyloglobulus morosus]